MVDRSVRRRPTRRRLALPTLRAVPVNWLTIDGCRIRYRVEGEGPPAVITPGGRAAMDDVTVMAEALRPHFRLLEWDRRNAGASDVWFGPESEQRRWADDLAILLDEVGFERPWVMGGSAGARVSYLTAIRHPDHVGGLVLWSVSGGAYGSQNLGHDYHRPFIDAAIRGGMAAVAATPFFAARIAANPDNALRLGDTDPADLIAAMRLWNEDFFGGLDVPCTTDDELRAISCPTLVFEGNDDMHPAPSAQAVARLVPGAVLTPCVWSRDDFMSRLVGRPGAGSVFDLYPAMVDEIVAFTGKSQPASRSTT
jgi:pimeloyl-ACP methyl ester carboxylesterase